jgi:uncharacterized membrane protein YdfJ with MMPL/SSD domain
MLSGLGGILYRWRKGLPFLILVLVLGMAWYGSGVLGMVHSLGMEDPNSESSRALAVLDDHFPRQATDITLLVSSTSLRATDPEFEQAATAMLTKIKGRAEVSSLTSYYDTHNTALLSRDQHVALVMIELKSSDSDDGKAKYLSLKPFFTASPLQVEIGGELVSTVQLSEQLEKDLVSSEIIGLPIVVILLIIIFGGVIAALLPLLVGGVVIAGAFAIMRLLTTFIDVSSFATNVITVIGLGLAIDYSLFLVTRFREELLKQDVRGALRRTMATAGRTVLFSGLTVGTSLLALLLFPQVMLRSIGMAIIAVALMAMLATLVVLPVLLALLGRHVNALSLQRLFRRSGSERAVTQGLWYRLTYWVMRWALPVALLVLTFLLLLGYPFLHVKFALPDYRSIPTETSARTVADRLQQDFAGQDGSQINVIVRVPGKALDADNLARLDTYVRDLKGLSHVTGVNSLVTVDPRLTLAQYQQLYQMSTANPQIQQAATVFADGDLTQIIVRADVDPASQDAKDLVQKVRNLKFAESREVLVGGEPAKEKDQFEGLLAVIPSALAVMFGAIFLLLFLMTGSLIMPIKAVILNILSLSATFGMMVWIFQDGHLQNLLGFQSVGSLDATEPVLIFAVAFGLSMDYEVFLLSRIKEIFDRTGDNRESVAQGLQRTGWLITSAALLLAVVVGTFAGSKIIYLKEIGLGVALAIIMDATLVRGLLVPAMMRMLGNLNWWAPRPLRAVWQRVGLSEAHEAEPEPVSVPTMPVSKDEEVPTGV